VTGIEWRWEGTSGLVAFRERDVVCRCGGKQRKGKEEGKGELWMM
jgi:hypothetical protein